MVIVSAILILEIVEESWLQKKEFFKTKRIDGEIRMNGL